MTASPEKSGHLATPPPENLVIYEVQGSTFPDESPILGSGFLGMWIEGDYTFFFFDRDAHPDLASWLAARSLNLRHVHRLKYTQWQDGAGSSPFSVGPLTFVPAWPPGPPPDNRTVVIDPGLAFGFGGHPTTRACLEVLVRVFREDHPETALDLGTGTGVLALAAARLGAIRVLAVDYSHLAADTARNNVHRNGLASVIQIARGRAEDHADHPAQLVVANLHGQAQEALMDMGGFSDRRWLILSGFFHEEGVRIESRLVQSGYRLVDRIRDQRWVTLLLKTRRP